MPKKAYIGINNTNPTRTITITSANINDYFTVENAADCYFEWSGTTQLAANNKDQFIILNTTARTEWITRTGGSLTFSYNISTEVNADFFTVTVDGVTALQISGITTGTQTLELEPNSRIAFLFSKDGDDDSSARYSDTCIIDTITFTYPLAIGEVARPVKNIYLGIDNIARRIKLAYIGIGGVARPWWFQDPFTHFGQQTRQKGGVSSAVSTKNYAIFAGGYGRKTDGCNLVDAFDSNLIQTFPTPLNVSLYKMGATSVGDYALFGGGHSYDSMWNYNKVYAYNSSLVQSSPTTQLYGAVDAPGATSIGGYAIFAGGSLPFDDNDGYSTRLSTAIAYDTSLTQRSVASLSSGRADIATASTNNYAFFAGGNSSTPSYRNYHSNVDIYNTSLTRSTSQLNQPRAFAEGASIKDYCLILGGTLRSGDTAIVEAYDNSLTRFDLPALRTAVYHPKATKLNNNYTIVAGETDSYYIYDTNLTYFLAQGKHDGAGAAATVGSYAIFTDDQTTIDIFTI